MKKLLLLVLSVLLVSAIAFSFDPETFVNLTIGEPETLDPHYCYETAGGAVILNVYDNLIKYKGDSVTVFEPMISTEVPTVENGLIKDGGTKYVFPIREGIKFHSCLLYTSPSPRDS